MLFFFDNSVHCTISIRNKIFEEKEGDFVQKIEGEISIFYFFNCFDNDMIFTR